eukprot:gene11708-14898_t
MALLAASNVKCHTYLSGINPREYAMYPMYEEGICTYGQTTSNYVEQEMNRFNKLSIRTESPLKFFQNLVELWL